MAVNGILLAHHPVELQRALRAKLRVRNLKARHTSTRAFSSPESENTMALRVSKSLSTQVSHDHIAHSLLAGFPIFSLGDKAAYKESYLEYKVSNPSPHPPSTRAKLTTILTGRSYPSLHQHLRRTPEAKRHHISTSHQRQQSLAQPQPEMR